MYNSVKDQTGNSKKKINIVFIRKEYSAQIILYTT